MKFPRSKQVFYPEPEVETELRQAPPKKISERVNQLVLKGLAYERELALRAEYRRLDKLASEAANPAAESQERLMAAERLFEPGRDEEGEEEGGFF